MADIETLLGLRSGGNQAALAAALRGQARGGDVLSLSTLPQVAAMGEAQRRRAVRAATAGGVQADREAGREQQQAMQAERLAQQQTMQDERIAASAREGALNRGSSLAAARLRGAGRKGSSDYWYAPQTVKLRGVNLTRRANRAGEVEYDIPGVGTFTQAEFDALSDAEVDTVRKTAQAKATGAALAESQTQAGETVAAYGDLSNIYSGALNQIGYGAETGPIASRFISVSGPTTQFEQLRDQAALAMLGLTPKSLAPMSDRDIDLLTSAALPEKVDQTYLYYWLVHRRESLARAREALEFKQEYIRENGQMPSQKEMDAVSKRGGFSFAAPPANETGAMIQIMDLHPDDHERFKALPLSAQREYFIKAGGPTYGREGMPGASPPG